MSIPVKIVDSRLEYSLFFLKTIQLYKFVCAQFLKILDNGKSFAEILVLYEIIFIFLQEVNKL